METVKKMFSRDTGSIYLFRMMSRDYSSDEYKTTAKRNSKYSIKLVSTTMKHNL